VGGNKLLRADFRVVAATNRDLEAEVAAGRFREDLFHRLNVVRVRLPPLRERAEDVGALLDHFVDRFRQESGRAALRLTPEVRAHLGAYAWPGNVRELVNCARYLAGLARGPEADLADLPPGLRAPLPTAPAASPPPSDDAPPVDAIRPEVPYKTAKLVWSAWFDELYLQRLLAAHGLKRRNISHWLVHSGGKKVVDAIKYNIGISEWDVRHTHSVLRDYGNLSSGSFLFSYERLLHEGRVKRGDYGVMMTMGPGSTIETALIRW
jgi:DNA-binding NtrC family response regulator